MLLLAEGVMSRSDEGIKRFRQGTRKEYTYWLEIPPCTDCFFYTECATGLACQDFINFYETGKVTEEERFPERKYYIKLFESKYNRG